MERSANHREHAPSQRDLVPAVAVVQEAECDTERTCVQGKQHTMQPPKM